MSMKLREIIKAVRACKTAEEERSVINKEAAEIRNLPKDQSDQLKARNILKCIYMHFLGILTKYKFYLIFLFKFHMKFKKFIN